MAELSLQIELTRPATPGLGRVRPGPEEHPAMPSRPLGGEDRANPNSMSIWDSAVNFLQHTS